MRSARLPPRPYSLDADTSFGAVHCLWSTLDVLLWQSCTRPDAALRTYRTDSATMLSPQQLMAAYTSKSAMRTSAQPIDLAASISGPLRPLYAPFSIIKMSLICACLSYIHSSPANKPQASSACISHRPACMSICARLCTPLLTSPPSGHTLSLRILHTRMHARRLSGCMGLQTQECPFLHRTCTHACMLVGSGTRMGLMPAMNHPHFC